MRDRLWQIVAGTKRLQEKPTSIVAEKSELYLLGEPEDPVAVWEKLASQFQRKTLANKLEFRRRLCATKL